MEPSEIYLAIRTRLLDVAPSLTTAQRTASLAATPPWTVDDAFRHLTGVCSDILDGAMEGAGSPQWTAAQLARRADQSLEQVCQEWAERAPELDQRIADAGRAMAFAAFDAWTHEQDVRAAAGLPTDRDGAVVESLAPLTVATFQSRYSQSGAPAVAVFLVGVDGNDAEPIVLGEGAASATLRVTPYELLRIVFGRRSRAQVEAANWENATPAVIDAFHLFPFPDATITD